MLCASRFRLFRALLSPTSFPNFPSFPPFHSPMKKIFTLAAAGVLATAALSAQAQITLDGVITAAEIGTGNNKYQSAGTNTTPHVSDKGFGNWGLLQMYTASGGANNSKLYLAVAGTLQKSGNGLQFWMGGPISPTGAPVPVITGTSTMFDGISKAAKATQLEFAPTMALALKGDAGGNIPQVAVYGTTSTAKALTPVLPLTGAAVTVTAADATGDFARFMGMRQAYKDTQSGSLVTDFPNAATDPKGPGNPGTANGGGAGSYGWEVELDRKNLGVVNGGGVYSVFSAYVSDGGYWSSDVIPEVIGKAAANANDNLGDQPNFVTLPGVQAAVFTITLATKQEDAASVAVSVFPNPATDQSIITYRVLNQAAKVRIELTDMMGRKVSVLENSFKKVGIQQLALRTGSLSAGTYLVRVQVGDKVATRRVTL